MTIQVVWVELPVKDIERAVKFYQDALGVEAEIVDDGVRKTATLAHESGVGISLNQTTNFEGSDKGAFVYVYAGEDIDAVLPRIEPAGGKVLTQKTSMGAAGYYATIHDTEGNVLALYSAE
ncbi:MAG: glyoxalase [Anaerolineaceae bacterium]|nr:glyoxalase [Anaerolineaceae bacterium]